jgi:hypothetical protein
MDEVLFMSYQHNFILKKTGPAEWTLYTEKGLAVYSINDCLSRLDAEAKANAWVSSWPSSIVRVDEQDELGNKVPRKA